MRKLLFKLLLPLIRVLIKCRSPHLIPDLNPNQCRMLAHSVSRYLKLAPNQTIHEAIEACYLNTHTPAMDKYLDNPVSRMLADAEFLTMQTRVCMIEKMEDPSFDDVANNKNISPLAYRVHWVNRTLLYNGQTYGLTLAPDTNKVSIKA